MGKRKFNLTKAELENLYINQELSSKKIANILGLTNTTVLRYLHNFNIKVRKPGDPNESIEISGKFLEILQGHLLGDGSISDLNSINNKFTIASKYFDYIKEICLNINILQPKIIRVKQKLKYKNENREYTQYSLYTKHLISDDFGKKWYPNGKKEIPKDLILTPTTCLYWYIDDGSLHKNHGGIYLCTDSFTEKNLRETVLPQLQQILNCQNGKIKIHKTNKKLARIYIPRKYTKKFLKYIGKCPVSCYAYKWDIKPYKRNGYRYLE